MARTTLGKLAAQLRIAEAAEATVRERKAQVAEVASRMLRVRDRLLQLKHDYRLLQRLRAAMEQRARSLHTGGERRMKGK